MNLDAFIKSLSEAVHYPGEKWAPESYHKSPTELENFYDRAPCGCHALDEKGIFLEINDMELGWLGCTRAQLVGKMHFSDFVTAISRKLFEEEFARLKERGWVKDLELEIIGQGGPVRPVLLNATALYDHEGNFLRSNSTLYDISQQKQTGYHLGLLSEAMNTLGEAAFITDENALFRFVNEEACRLLGYTHEELLKMGVYDIDADFTIDHWPKHWAQVKEKRALNFESRHRAKDGRIYPVEINANLFEYKGKAYHFALVHDITERKRLQEHAKQVQQFLRMQIARMPIGLIVLDNDFRVQAWNPAVASIFGFTEREAKGRHPFDLIVPRKIQPVVTELWNRLLKGDGTTDSENENITKDGRTILCQWTNTPLKTSEGNIIGVMSIVQDITERKQTERALRRVNRELHTISECNQVLMRATDESLLLKDICRIVCRDTEYKMAWVGYAEKDEAKTVRPMAWAGSEDECLATANVVWSDTELGRGPTGTAIRTGKTNVQDLQSGHLLHYWREEALKHGLHAAISMPLKDESGAVFGAFTIYSRQPDAFTPDEVRRLEELAGNLAFGIRVLRGRRERKRALEEVRKLNAELEQRVDHRTQELIRRTQELETIFNTVPVGLAIAYDEIGSHILGNPALEEMAGVPHGSEVSLTATVRPVYHARDAKGKEIPGSELPMQRACRGEVISGEVMEIVRADGKTHLVFSNARPVLDEAGRPHGAIGAFMDITARKQAEEEIRKLNEALQHRASELEAANRELEAFSYSASHDLRAPLRSIDGYSHILLEENASQLTAEGKAHLEEVCRATERMSHLIDGMLTLSRITRTQVRSQTVNLSAVASEVIDELRRLEPNRKVEVQIERNLRAKGDPELLHILLGNLLGNAWKFSGRQSRANIQFGQIETDAGAGFFVRDNGVGFDMKYANKLFGAFQRLHKTGDFPGTGIGLATVHRVISRHGGRIWAESRVDQGTTFYFTLGPQANGRP